MKVFREETPDMPFYDYIVTLTLGLDRWDQRGPRRAPPPRLRLRAAQPAPAKAGRGILARLQALCAALNRRA